MRFSIGSFGGTEMQARQAKSLPASNNLPENAGKQPVENVQPLRLRTTIARIYREFSEDRILTVAGGITFFVLLALFPAIGATVSLYGMFAERSEIVHDLDLLSGFLPGGAVAILHGELERLLRQKPESLNIAFGISFLIALWSASGGFKALVEGLNVAFEVKETRSPFRQTIGALIFTLAAIFVTVMGIEAGMLFSRFRQYPAALQTMANILVWPLLFVCATIVSAVVYRFGPDRPLPQWRWLTWGSAISSLLWMLGTELFTWYVRNYGSYNRIYGDLGAVVGFLTWVWLSLVILLLGAEINCELERR